MGFKAADDCMHIDCSIGLTTGLTIKKTSQQQRSYGIIESASEVVKMVNARHVLHSN